VLTAVDAANEAPVAQANLATEPMVPTPPTQDS